ncbi:MAG: beta-lactamase family protein [Nannocystis sp.]|nr:serine hydrolase domain-containing protein [Nannocystis sp.]MBA3544914.1 beta-lactamase family protein [Nannocystis sp.]
MHDEPRSDLERQALAAWTAQEPPPGFADRVLAADVRPPAKPPIELPRLPRLGLSWPGMAAAALVAVAIAGSVAAAVNWWPSSAPQQQRDTPSPREGHERRTPASLSLPDAPKPTALTAPAPAEMAAKIDAYLGGFGRLYGDAFKLHGSVVVLRGDERLYERGLGVTQLVAGKPVSPDTRFKIGSLSQQFTAVAILQLRDAGKLGLDDPLKKHLRNYPGVGDGITLRQLLSHTSGVPNYTENLALAEIVPGRVYSPRQIRATFETRPLEFPPGTDFDPSNAGYFLLGLVVEQVSGHSLADYVRDNIARPAGLRHTTVQGAGALPDAPMATGHEFSEEEVLVPVAALDLSVYGGAAGVVSTANDLARFDHALRVPGLLLSGRSLTEMYTPVRNSYGLGWLVQQDHGQTMVGHPGGVEGFNAAWLRFIGPGGITVIALANTEAVDCRQIAHDIAAIAHGEEVDPPLEYKEQPVSIGMYERYLGDFNLSERTRGRLAGIIDGDELDLLEGVRVYVDDGRLFMLVPLHGAKWLHASGPDAFFFKDPAGTLAQFGPPGAPVTTLTLRQGDLEFILVRGKPGAPNSAIPDIAVHPGAYRNTP